MRRNIKLVIAYDGTDFCGWQRQDKDRTVQGEIELALEKMHGEPVSLAGCGRTDSGVHAVGQIANFFTDIDSIPSDRFSPALNTLLPHDVRILHSCGVDDNFHARFSAVSRTYRYFFICRSLLPHQRLYNVCLRRFPDIALLNAYGRLLLGETDCSIFAGAGDTSNSKNRYIYSSVFFTEGEKLIFEIRANAFLRNMVRSVAGTFLHYEENSASPEQLRKIIASGERSQAGPTLPPQGLFLWNVEY
ncbi:MAG: tRNA pseudouridine(38-40) synthase TruA [Treponema sp.]|nr:tRNA pseudouridine(38-40) synthase TruA [Treponema sp.]MCL2272168.1 tRNA pseudouridine(38-40) synthase TruA [Treponema sp.]